jgi:iron complex outermembrane receptor protein
MSTRGSQLAIGCFGVLTFVSFTPAPARAESAEAAATPSGSAIEEIVVTARRREERLQDVPVAATAFTKSEIDRYATEALSDVAARTPQLTIGPANANGGTINLRGIQSPTNSNVVDQAVAINIDGVQVSQANVLRLGQYDLERIEILKGPQTLFYGKNSPAGVISIITANPSRQFGGYARAGYEFEAERKFAEATVTGPLGAGFAFRLNGYIADQKGWFINTATPIGTVAVPAALGGGSTTGVGARTGTGPNETNYVLRAGLDYINPDKSFESTLKVSYSHQDQDNGIAAANQHIHCVGSAPQYVLLLGLPGPTDCKLDRYYNEPDFSPAQAKLAPMYGDGREFLRTRSALVSWATNYSPVEAVKISAISGYYELDDEWLGNFAYDNLSFVSSTSRGVQQQFSQEVRAQTSFAFPANFMVGAYYQHMRNQTFGNSVFDDPLTKAFTGGFFSGPILGANNVTKQLTDAYSLFGQLIVDISPELQLTAGARYSHETKKISGTSFPNTFSQKVIEGIFTPNERSFDNVSPDVTLTYKARPNLTLYGAYREGFVSGGFDLGPGTLSFGRTTVSDISYDQETVRGGEVGAKGYLGNRNFVFDLAAYYYQYQGLQLSAFDPNTLSFRLTNAAAATVKGAEASVQWDPPQVQGLSLRGDLAYNPTRYDNFRKAPCYPGQTQAQGCNLIAATGAVVTPTQVGNAQDLTGHRLHVAPEWSASVGGSYRHVLGNGMSAELSTDAAYTSSYFGNSTQEPASRQDSFWRLNAGLSVRGADDRWEVDLIGTNLTNVLRATSTYVLVGTGGRTGTPAGFSGDEMGLVSNPRAITLQGKYRF